MKKKIYLANNLHLYRRKVKSCYVEVPIDDALLFLYSKAEEDSEALPETQVASVLHISRQAVNKRKQKILEKMKAFSDYGLSQPISLLRDTR